MSSHSTGSAQTVVCALYKFVRLDNFAEIRQPLLDLMVANEVRGTLLLAQEGINGTIAGSRSAIDVVLAWLNQDQRLNPVDFKESFTSDNPFMRTKVKLKKEIVTMGVEGVDPNKVVGTYVKPADWNQLISDPEVVLVDTRNDYEVAIGTFENAIDPHTQTFREFPQYVAENLDPEKHKKVAMFCTGGIRCEKSTAYLKEQGFDEVYHLEGGILKYLEEIPESDSMWQGDCFVFDGRVSVKHGLEVGDYDQCHACRKPITAEDKMLDTYVQGVSCRYCIDSMSEKQKQRFEERERQVRLAKARGEVHLGAAVKEAVDSHRQAKAEFKAAQKQRS